MKTYIVKKVGAYFSHLHTLDVPLTEPENSLVSIAEINAQTHNMLWYRRSDGLFEACCERNDVRFIEEALR